jgi:hypothetical protein
MKLLSIQNDIKTSKGNGYGYMTAICYLEPDPKLCPHASPNCMPNCITTSGMMPMVKNSRVERSEFYHDSKTAFNHLVIAEIKAFIKKARRKELIPVVRLNGTSDIVWEAVKIKGQTIFEMFPDIQFYDYTPNAYRFKRKLPDNYHLTFSRKDGNDTAAKRLASEGVNVAVVFGGDKLPKTFYGKKVIDGDKHDLRFLDKKGVIVGLKAKGKARKETSGFVVHV